MVQSAGGDITKIMTLGSQAMFSSEDDIRTVVSAHFEYGKVIAKQINAMYPIFQNRNADNSHVAGTAADINKYNILYQ